MGRAHTIAYREVGAVFDLPAAPVLEIIAEIDARTRVPRPPASWASGAPPRTGANWCRPRVDLVDITARRRASRIAIAAQRAGKHV